MVEGVKALGLETCMTLGMLTAAQARRWLKAPASTTTTTTSTPSERYYREVVTTRTFADRLETLERVRDAGIKVCCGGIVGMGESVADRVDMLVTLANLPEPPDSVPINMLIPIPGTPLAGAAPIRPFDFVRTIALARIMMPTSEVRLSAGRSEMSDELQALCFFAGANSIFVGETLLTADNPGEAHDLALLRELASRPRRSARRLIGFRPIGAASACRCAARRRSPPPLRGRAVRGSRRRDRPATTPGPARRSPRHERRFPPPWR